MQLPKKEKPYKKTTKSIVMPNEVPRRVLSYTTITIKMDTMGRQESNHIRVALNFTRVRRRLRRRDTRATSEEGEEKRGQRKKSGASTSAAFAGNFSIQQQTFWSVAKRPNRHLRGKLARQLSRMDTVMKKPIGVRGHSLRTTLRDTHPRHASTWEHRTQDKVNQMNTKYSCSINKDKRRRLREGRREGGTGREKEKTNHDEVQRTRKVIINLPWMKEKRFCSKPNTRVIEAMTTTVKPSFKAHSYEERMDGVKEL